MSKIISFAWTTPALLAGRKTCTRRDWKDKFGLSFHGGELIQAWDKNPRSHGMRVAWIRLTVDPYPQLMKLMPDSDYEAEGFQFFEEHPEELPSIRGPMGASRTDFENWRNSPQMMWVVRFELEEVLVTHRLNETVVIPEGFTGTVENVTDTDPVWKRSQ